MAEERSSPNRGPATGSDPSLPGRASDEELVARAREGDTAAFDELVRRHYARVHALLFRMVGNHEDAEDLAQDAFVKAHAALAWFRGEARFASWLYRIALHLSRDHFRKRGRRVQETALAELVEPEALALPAPGDEASRRELVGRLATSLERLPHRVHAAFVLRTFEGLDYNEIGQILGITDGTARVHVMKARRLLERFMSPWLDRGER